MSLESLPEHVFQLMNIDKIDISQNSTNSKKLEHLKQQMM